MFPSCAKSFYPKMQKRQKPESKGHKETLPLLLPWTWMAPRGFAYAQTHQTVFLRHVNWLPVKIKKVKN